MMSPASTTNQITGTQFRYKQTVMQHVKMQNFQISCYMNPDNDDVDKYIVIQTSGKYHIIQNLY